MLGNGQLRREHIQVNVLCITLMKTGDTAPDGFVMDAFPVCHLMKDEDIAHIVFNLLPVFL